ncbi:MAG: hypothetical protein GX620_13265 [Chloroflexi bacterium]|nr:hypothetical protein [Chloroflexota bacterium]
MSMVEERVLSCPRCGNAQKQEIWQSVNIQLDSDMKQKILDGEYNVFACEKCRAELPVDLPMMYHDMDGKLMIWLLPRDQSLKQTIMGHDAEAKRLLGVTHDGYRKRFVHSRLQLAETIRIFDDGLDDRAVALFKVSYAHRHKMQPDDILYCGLEHDPRVGMVLTFFRRDSESSFVWPMDGYQRAQGIVNQCVPPENGLWTTVDHEYADRIASVYEEAPKPH